jgi:hypothetical protein
MWVAERKYVNGHYAKEVQLRMHSLLIVVVDKSNLPIPPY